MVRHAGHAQRMLLIICEDSKSAVVRIAVVICEARCCLTAAVCMA